MLTKKILAKNFLDQNFFWPKNLTKFFMILDLESGTWDLGFRIWDSGFGFGICDLESGIWDSGSGT